jgi:hypothetical protein
MKFLLFAKKQKNLEQNFQQTQLNGKFILAYI